MKVFLTNFWVIALFEHNVRIIGNDKSKNTKVSPTFGQNPVNRETFVLQNLSFTVLIIYIYGYIYTPYVHMYTPTYHHKLGINLRLRI